MIVILGIFAVVAYSVRGVIDRGEVAACDADARTLTQSSHVYMAQHQVDVLGRWEQLATATNLS